MIRNILLLVTGLGIAAVLSVVAQRLYRSDTYGMRTAMAKRSPVSHEEQDLTGQNLQGAFLPYANFRMAKLHETILSDANVQFADFTGADFEMAGLSDTNFSHAIFHKAHLKNARWLDSSVFRQASFRDTDLSWVSFHGLYGKHRRSTKRHMMDPGAGGADLTGAIFEEAVCQNAIFSRCLLTGANFKGSDCREANFTHADLRNADFTNADVRGAKFDGADLTGAIFTNAKK